MLRKIFLRNYWVNFYERKWSSFSDRSGHASAQGRLGALYAKGLGITQDYVKAIEWLQKAVRQGNMDAQFFLAELYNNGKGVKKDKRKALELMQKSADQGYKLAIQFLEKNKEN